MSQKNKSFTVWGALTILTAILYLFGNMAPYPSRALPLIWAFFSWNLYAYAVDRGMWPVTFVELDGQGKGNQLAREVVFWATAAVYLLLLTTIAWAEW